jgi:redox-sensitive bicupin YhaK (pirin superfamily)
LPVSDVIPYITDSKMNNVYKNIKSVMPPPPYHMVGDGFRVHNFFPSQQEIGMKGMSPFFLLDYGSKWIFPPSEKPRGVGVHPHRGFETVTIAYHGSIAHHDSAGNSGVIGEGDVQWMTAGSGVLHKEYHEKEFSRKGGLMQMAQIWVNLPAEYKMTPAKYQAIVNSDMGRYMLADGQSFIEVIAGKYMEVSGPASTFSPVNLFNAKLKTSAQAGFSFSSGSNTGMLIVEGGIRINGDTTAAGDHFILFGHSGEEIRIEALKDSIVLVFNGDPINEPIASYGPFVMNTQEEIKQAYEDYYNGKFGYLED